MTYDEKIRSLYRFIEESDKTVFFGGAGVSTESGVPDFRSKNGLYNQHDVRFEGYSPEYLLSHTCLEKEPKVFFEFYRQKMDTRNIDPNFAHRYLAAMEKYGKLTSVITQNIDGLHTKAGSKNVFEIHGTTYRNYCMKCGKVFDPDYIFDSVSPIPKCSCGGTVRCDVTLYEESLPDCIYGAIDSISEADLLIIGGTSLTVYPAASFIGYFKGKHTVVINRDSLNVDISGNVLQINESIGKVFKDLNEYTEYDIT